ncbi:tRNA modification GTPase TrmE [Owenweeksia hongkongensis DSM 17368]|uniref:tRNA modification GTPase MnmE n=1 Tax=Owenweeksia hongkongensis (strain DSM 17368 / CIP 108786 / JCM 12287 / NRRL B-23963 / UST20020801) TaxID=926562 RepID=G8QZW1_OWEHD|nr:tRNA uridine-5-carboxymethylaminomethyl(34) synthesis GTPase MnmE [Owenweeksia hongkongensis]AEV31555.1 tRNA modification GTPase TrmE [Owenweeksia hongkongensis DSM 17368]
MRMDDTICALSTPQGMGAIAMIRISGSDTFPILEKTFKAFSPRHNPSEAKPYSLVFGKMVDGQTIVDEVMVGIFKGPHSYTGEDVAEISCHGSVYIQEQIIRLLLKNGCRMADPGEYTMRAFTAGKMDLSQAEAVADLIESESKAAHQVAMQQMRGGFSDEIKGLRTELINFASLIELELDFGEEDVEFADRTQLSELLLRIKSVISRLLESFDTGNVIKNGVPVAIVGAPNAGKSTLLNALLNEEKAIVTDVAGTTRDAIEDEISLGGVKFRFIDTAGIRETEDLVESIGIKKTFEKIEQSRIVMYLFNAQSLQDNVELIRNEIAQLQEKTKGKTLLVLANKMDLIEDATLLEKLGDVENLIPISALQKRGLKELETRLTSEINLGALNSNQTIVTNARHFSALQQSLEDILRVEQGMENNISGDFLAMDIREALKHLGSIIGEVETDRDILGNIFGKFCIGK